MTASEFVLQRLEKSYMKMNKAKSVLRQKKSHSLATAFLTLV